MKESFSSKALNVAKNMLSSKYSGYLHLPISNNMKEQKKEADELNNKLSQFTKYIKSVLEEKKQAKEKFLQSSSQSRKDSNRSQTFKNEEKNQNYKITFQQFINYDEKNKNNKISGQRLLLNDIEDDDITNDDDRITLLLDLLKNYKDCIIENPFCGSIEDITLLEIYTALSRKSFDLFRETCDVEHTRNYFKSLKSSINYDFDSNPNKTMNMINGNFIDITEGFQDDKKPKEKKTLSIIEMLSLSSNKKFNPEDYDDEEDQSGSSSSSSDSEDSSKNESDSTPEIIEAEEVNEENQHKIIFFDEKKKKTEKAIRRTETLEYQSDKLYVDREKHLKGLRENIYDNIIKLIRTEGVLLPRYRHEYTIDRLMKFIDKATKLKLKKKRENHFGRDLKHIINRRSIFQFADYDDSYLDDDFYDIDDDVDLSSHIFNSSFMNKKESRKFIRKFNNTNFDFDTFPGIMRADSELDMRKLQNLKLNHLKLIKN